MSDIRQRDWSPDAPQTPGMYWLWAVVHLSLQHYDVLSLIAGARSYLGPKLVRVSMGGDKKLLYMTAAEFLYPQSPEFIGLWAPAEVPEFPDELFAALVQKRKDEHGKT